jgi:hypothetical protein
VFLLGETLKPNTPHKPLPADAGENAIARLDKLRNAKGDLKTAEIRRNMQRTMQNDAAVFRTQQTLEEGCAKIDETVASFEDVKVGRGRNRGMRLIRRRMWKVVAVVGGKDVRHYLETVVPEGQGQSSCRIGKSREVFSKPSSAIASNSESVQCWQRHVRLSGCYVSDSSLLCFLCCSELSAHDAQVAPFRCPLGGR